MIIFSFPICMINSSCRRFLPFHTTIVSWVFCLQRQTAAHLWLGYFIISVALPTKDLISCHLTWKSISHLFSLCWPSSTQFKVTLPFTSWSLHIPYVVGSRHPRGVCVWAVLICVAMAPCLRGCPGSMQRSVITGSTQLDVLTKQTGRHF